MKMTPEQKKQYYRALRNNWKAAKEYANVDAIKAIIAHHGLNISIYSFAFVQRQMEKNNFDGIPYIDMKTYGKWRESGYQVIKGEKSKVNGLTWIPVSNKSNKETEETEGEKPNSYMMPKSYRLFHRSQVTEI